MKNSWALSIARSICVGGLIASGVFSSFVAAEDSVQLVMTGSNRAIVLFNDERVVLRQGVESHADVSLVKSNSEKAVLLVHGEEMTLDINVSLAPVLLDDDEGVASEASVENVTLWAASDGFFYAKGEVNRRSIRFLVDTGATSVAFSSVDADRLGIDYKSGQRGYATTASGVTEMMAVTIDRISVEGITLRNIQASVILGRFPDIPLLGGSFLSKLNMERSGKKMTLSRR